MTIQYLVISANILQNLAVTKKNEAAYFNISQLICSVTTDKRLRASLFFTTSPTI